MIDTAAIIVAATTMSRGIGSRNALPWNLPSDMSHFYKKTSTPPSSNLQNCVIMGRNTWCSIPSKFRPLKKRFNVVLSSNPNLDGASSNKECCIVASSLNDAFEKIDALDNIGNIFIIGGSRVYNEAMKNSRINKLYYTEVDANDEVESSLDTFFPNVDLSEWVLSTEKDWQEENQIRFRFLEYDRRRQEEEKKEDVAVEKIFEEGVHVNPEEMQYLDLCRKILNEGVQRGDRTGTGTLSLFGTQMRFSLRDGTLPLLTTKRTFWRGVAEELLWFISGSTNANLLADKNIHIWDGNGSREFLDSRGLTHREVGDLGPVYGFQWRHFGAKYNDMHTDYTDQGVDQLAECIHKIKTNPTDRRIVLSAWNPVDFDAMALPPCHLFCQFYVDTDKQELSCQMYQRSADMGLGVPFNIASYALLTHMIAQVCGLKAGDFIHTIGDAHVYNNHVDALQEQMERLPRAFPKLIINKEKKDIDDFVFEDFKVDGYHPHKSISMKMAV